MKKCQRLETMHSKLFPTYFIAHGSPMNALANNTYTKTLRQLGSQLDTPSAIVCVSAHWMTNGTYVTHMSQPKTIHDFYGFPDELFQIQYPAPGSPSTAEKIQKILTPQVCKLDDQQWGLDHGTWSVLKHLYPLHNIPVVQLSLDMNLSPMAHYELGKKLRELRKEKVLLIGSGNIVHNLRRLDWAQKTTGYDWAVNFNDWFKTQIEMRNVRALTTDLFQHPDALASIPTAEHYLPFLYILGASADDTNQANDQDNEKLSEKLQIAFEGYELGSISMLSFGWEAAAL